MKIAIKIFGNTNWWRFPGMAGNSPIHPKSWGLNSANILGFSANVLAENPELFKFALCLDNTLLIFSN